MAIYEIRFTDLTVHKVKVEAETRDEAIRKAKDGDFYELPEEIEEEHEFDYFEIEEEY